MEMPEFTDCSDDESISYSNYDEEVCPLREEKSLFPPAAEDAFEYLQTVWDELNPPVTESLIQGSELSA